MAGAMTFMIDHPETSTVEEVMTREGAYRRYLQEHRGMFRSSAYEFATAEWHYDPTDHRCPHDAWVEEVSIVESGTGARGAVRNVEIRVQLLGAYHDGTILLNYRGVCAYSLSAPILPPSGRTAVGHGDWLIDEFVVEPDGRIRHDVVFSGGGRWSIELADVEYTWAPFAGVQ